MAKKKMKPSKTKPKQGNKGPKKKPSRPSRGFDARLAHVEDTMEALADRVGRLERVQALGRTTEVDAEVDENPDENPDEDDAALHG